MQRIKDSLYSSADLKRTVADTLSGDILEAANRIKACLQKGGKLILMGNGGSAGDSQHIAAELIGRFKKERKAIPAIALTVDTSSLTALGNDYGFETIFGEPVETKIFYDGNNISKAEIIELIESEEVVLPLRDGSKLKREIDFEVADEGKLLGKISVNEYEKGMFKAYDRKFNKYSKQNIDSLKVLIYPMSEAGKSSLYRMLSYLTSHLSSWNGIHRLTTSYDSEPQAYVYYNEAVTPLDTVKAALSMEKMSVHFRGGEIILVDNPFKSKPDGIVKNASEINN